MRLKNAPTRLHIILIFIFGLLFGFSMYALWKINTGTLEVRLAWPWLVSLVVSAIGLLMLARDTK